MPLPGRTVGASQVADTELLIDLTETGARRRRRGKARGKLSDPGLAHSSEVGIGRMMPSRESRSLSNSDRHSMASNEGTDHGNPNFYRQIPGKIPP